MAQSENENVDSADGNLRKESLSYVTDLAKQFIAISSAIITVCITFYEKLIVGEPGVERLFFVLSWVFFVLTIFFSLWTLMAAAGTIGKSDNGSGITIYASNLTTPGFLMCSSFIIAIVLTISGGAFAVF